MTTYYLTDPNKNWTIKKLTFPTDGTLNIYGNVVTNPNTSTNTKLGVSIGSSITGQNNVSIGYLVNNSLTTGTDNICIGSNVSVTGATISRNIAMGTGSLYNMSSRSGLASLYLASGGAYNGNFSGTFQLVFQLAAGPTPTTYPTGYATVVAATSNGFPQNYCFVTAVYLTSTGSGFTNSTFFNIYVLGLAPQTPATITPTYNNYNIGNDNIAIGYNAINTTNAGTYNTAIGSYALANLAQNLVDLTDNIAIGYKSQYRVIEGIRNIAIGTYTLSGLGGANNAYNPYDIICIGYNSMSNVNIGTTGSNTIVIGNNCFTSSPSNSQAINNLVIGNNAYQSVTSGYSNLIIGHSAGDVITTGNNNLILGYNGANALTTGTNNILLGHYAGNAMLSASYNTMIGSNCGQKLIDGTGNVAMGFNCFGGSAAGISNISSVAIGEAAGYSLVNNYSICIGYYAGGYAGVNYSGSNSNVFIGRTAGQYFQGSQSVFIGYQAGYINGTGTSAATNNVGIGTNALANLTSGANNTVVGTYGSVITGTTTGSNVTTLGYNALPSSATISNQITLGNSSVTSLRCAVTTITAISDVRDKKDIEDLLVGLDFINKIRPVKFTWNMRPDIETDASGNITEIHSTKNGDVEAGFIAQELDAVQDATNNEWLNLVYKDNPERLEATQGKLLPILVKAIQDLSAKVDSLSAEIAILKAKK
jgi:hypothetical protein